MNQQRIAFFLSTSGHSGVDRSIQLLIPELCERGYLVDLLKVRRHGPNIELHHPNFRQIDTGTRHTLLALPALKKYLKHEQPAALLSDKDRCNRLALLANLLNPNDIPVTVSSGTIMSENLKNRSWLDVVQHHLSMNYLYPRAHNIITPSVDAAEDLVNITRLQLAQINVVPLPIVSTRILEMANQRPNHSWMQNKSVPVLLSVGELSPRKDQATLIRAMAELVKSHDIRLLIAGRGKDEQTLKNLTKSLNLNDHIDFCGYQENPYSLMKNADIFVHTATFEGFGMVLTEAMALGPRVVAADCIGGPKEILENGRLGTLFPVGDHHALAMALRDMLDSEDTSRAERIASTQKYTVEASTSAYLQALGISA